MHMNRWTALVLIQIVVYCHILVGCATVPSQKDSPRWQEPPARRGSKVTVTDGESSIDLDGFVNVIILPGLYGGRHPDVLALIDAIRTDCTDTSVQVWDWTRVDTHIPVPMADGEIVVWGAMQGATFQAVQEAQKIAQSQREEIMAVNLADDRRNYGRASKLSSQIGAWRNKWYSKYGPASPILCIVALSGGGKVAYYWSDIEASNSIPRQLNNLVLISAVIPVDAKLDKMCKSALRLVNISNENDGRLLLAEFALKSEMIGRVGVPENYARYFHQWRYDGEHLSCLHSGLVHQRITPELRPEVKNSTK